MCARYSLIRGTNDIASLFHLMDLFDIAPRYNIAPSQPMLIVRPSHSPDKHREAAHVSWGLVPSWAKDPSIGTRMINARSETVDEKPSYRHAFRRRRCLVPADGFYEWRKPAHKGERKQPMHITVDEGLFAFAGLWEHWQSKDDGSEIETCTILTTEPNDLMAEIHNRMPVIIPRDAYDRWLDHPENESTDHVQDLLGAFPSEHMLAVPVSTYVSNPTHEGPQCVAPAEPPDGAAGDDQMSLFG